MSAALRRACSLALALVVCLGIGMGGRAQTSVEREPLAWATPEGWKIMGKEDHSVVEDVVWGETQYSDKYGFAILKNMQAIQAEQICRTDEEMKASRAAYEKRTKEKK